MNPLKLLIMKKIVFVFALLVSLIFLSFRKNQSGVTLKEVVVKAPFEMPSIKIPDFTNCKEYSIVDFGAIKGNKNKISEAIK